MRVVMRYVVGKGNMWPDGENERCRSGCAMIWRRVEVRNEVSRRRSPVVLVFEGRE